jgi:hypothetical protein
MDLECLDAVLARFDNLIEHAQRTCRVTLIEQDRGETSARRRIIDGDTECALIPARRLAEITVVLPDSSDVDTKFGRIGFQFEGIGIGMHGLVETLVLHKATAKQTVGLPGLRRFLDGASAMSQRLFGIAKYSQQGAEIAFGTDMIRIVLQRPLIATHGRAPMTTETLGVAQRACEIRVFGIAFSQLPKLSGGFIQPIAFEQRTGKVVACLGEIRIQFKRAPGCRDRGVKVVLTAFCQLQAGMTQIAPVPGRFRCMRRGRFEMRACRVDGTG